MSTFLGWVDRHHRGLRAAYECEGGPPRWKAPIRDGPGCPHRIAGRRLITASAVTGSRTRHQQCGGDSRGGPSFALYSGLCGVDGLDYGLYCPTIWYDNLW